MVTSHLSKSNVCDRFSRELGLIVATIALTSFWCLPHVCASSNDGQWQDYVPTLKEIYGTMPKNSFPVVHRAASMLRSNMDSSSKRAGLISESLRRGLRSKPHDLPDDLTMPVSSVGFSNANSGISEYFAQLQIGTPPQGWDGPRMYQSYSQNNSYGICSVWHQDLLLLIDTGSPALWVQSKQCVVCETQLLPKYDPKMSSTYEPELVNGSLVDWSASYGSSDNSGHIAKETLTIDDGIYGNQVVIPGIEFGVATNNTGVSYEFSGILGLGPYYPGVSISPLHFLTQLETISNGTYSKFSKTFRYCFPDRVKQINTTSFLSFGKIDESDTDSPFSATGLQHISKTLWTPLVPNGSPYYVLNLTAITVGGIIIPVDPQELTLESVQVNGTDTILDSGTDYTFIREPYFSQIVEAYSNLTVNLSPINAGVALYYNVSRDFFDGAAFPTVSFIFQEWGPAGVQGEIEIFQSKDNLFIPHVGEPITSTSEVIYMLNIVQAFDNTNIIGNYAQENFLIEFDLEKSRVGFLRASCTFDY